MAAADYQSNRDPALDAILAGPGAPAMDDIEAALLAGDTARAGAALTAARAAPINRYRNLEAEVNALGYRLMGSHRVEPAIAAFRLNTRAFPQSANAFDSLGEAYATAGRRDEAIAAFRAALERDPEYGPSRAWLERLGAR
jgi:tetratricopeptide (TPR) repeat protein